MDDLDALMRAAEPSDEEMPASAEAEERARSADAVPGGSREKAGDLSVRESGLVSGMLLAAGYLVTVVGAAITEGDRASVAITAAVAIVIGGTMIALGRFASQRLSTRASVALMSLAVVHLIPAGRNSLTGPFDPLRALVLLLDAAATIVAIDAVRIAIASQDALKEGKEPPANLARSPFERRILWSRPFWGGVAILGFCIAAGALVIRSGPLSHPMAATPSSDQRAAVEASAELSAPAEPVPFDPSSVGARFEDYPAPYYEGAFAKPDLSAQSGRWRQYEASAQNAAEGPPNFAGHYRAVEMSCGSDCRWFLFVDLASGRVGALPGGGEDSPHTQFLFRAESRLLKTVEPLDEGDDPTCMVRDYLWKGGAYEMLGSNWGPGRCP